MQVTFTYPTDDGGTITAVVTVSDDKVREVLLSLAGYTPDSNDEELLHPKKEDNFREQVIEMSKELLKKEQEIAELREEYIKSSAIELFKKYKGNHLQAVQELKARHDIDLATAKKYVDTVKALNDESSTKLS